MAKIPEPFSISYRPPEGDYQELPKVLDALHERLNMLESSDTQKK
jgi:hypothetical protein